MSDPLSDAPPIQPHPQQVRIALLEHLRENARKGGLSRSAKKLKALESNRRRSAEKFRLRREALEFKD